MITNTIRNLFQYLSGADLGGTWTYIGDPANFAVLGSTTTFWNTDDVLPSEDSNLPHIVKIGLLYLTEPGLYQFKYTVTDIYGCVSESIVKIYVSINYRSGVSKSDIVVCTNRTESSFVNLYDYLIPNSYDLGGTWSYIPNQFGSISISQTGIVNLYNLNPGLYQFKYETTNGNCLSSTIIDIQIEQGGNAGNDVDLGNFCYGDNEILNLSQQFIQSQICTPDCENPIDLTGNYIYVSGPALLVDVNGQTYNIDDIIVNTNLNLQVLAPGVYVVKYQIGNGLCDAFSLIKFTILDTPTIIFDNDLLQICSNPTNPPVTITAQVVSAYNGLPFVGPYTFKWYLNNQQLNNNSLVFSYTFVENETCEIQTSEVKLIVTTPSCGDYEKIGSIELYPYLDFFASDTPIEVCDSGEYNLNDYFTIPVTCPNTVITFTDNLNNVITNPDTYSFTTLGNVIINVNITQDICSISGFLFFNVTETSYAGEDTSLEVCKNCDNQVLLTTNYISLCIYDNLLPAPINLNDYILIGNGTWSQIGNPSFSGNIYTSSVVGIEEFQIISQKVDCPDSIQSLIIETKNCCEDNTQIFPKQVCPNIQYDLFNMISGNLSGIFAIDNIITNHIINTGNYTEGDHTVTYTISKPNCDDIVLTEILTIDCPGNYSTENQFNYELLPAEYNNFCNPSFVFNARLQLNINNNSYGFSQLIDIKNYSNNLRNASKQGEDYINQILQNNGYSNSYCRLEFSNLNKSIQTWVGDSPWPDLVKLDIFNICCNSISLDVHVSDYEIGVPPGGLALVREYNKPLLKYCGTRTNKYNFNFAREADCLVGSYPVNDILHPLLEPNSLELNVQILVKEINSTNWNSFNLNQVLSPPSGGFVHIYLPNNPSDPIYNYIYTNLVQPLNDLNTGITFTIYDGLIVNRNLDFDIQITSPNGSFDDLHINSTNKYCCYQFFNFPCDYTNTKTIWIIT